MSTHTHNHTHTEKHFGSSHVVKDIVLGMADGLTVPFALAAGLSSTVSARHIILTAGLAEIAAGSVAMGLGGYLAAKTAHEHFYTERAREEREAIEIPEVEAEEVAAIFRSYGLEEKSVQSVVKAISSDHNRWVDFMMKFELGIEKPDPKLARNSAVTIGLSYIIGGIIPLSPYFFFLEVNQALMASVVVTAFALFIFGFLKGKLTVGNKPLKSAFQTLVIGGLAGAVAFTLAKLIS